MTRWSALPHCYYVFLVNRTLHQFCVRHSEIIMFYISFCCFFCDTIDDPWELSVDVNWRLTTVVVAWLYVQLQTNMRRYVLADAVWSTMSDDDKDDHEHQFHRRKVINRNVTTSTDGRLTVPTVTQTARKPCQRQRVRAQRTTSTPKRM